MHEVMRLDKRHCRSLHIALKYKKSNTLATYNFFLNFKKKGYK
jgi:hypothetical protein